MPRQMQNYVFLALVGALLLAGAVVLLPAHREYREATKDLMEVDEELARQEEQILRIRREINSLKSDPRAIERVAREKFGYCKDGEKIYHFDDPEGP